MPRIGALRARTIVAWLRRHEATLGVKVAADVHTASLVPTGVAGAEGGDSVIVIGGDPAEPRLAPFEHLAVTAELSGGNVDNRGLNRATSFAFIRAEHDLAAVHAYLHRYRDRPTTLRAYTRELERLILWSVVVRQRALSSLTVEDCEAYKDFLKAPLASFTGPKRPRTSGRWRPFSPDGLSADSQAYAVRVLRAAFAWLVEVRYLAGNPWSAVHEPATVTRESAVQVQRALPAKLWAQVRAALDERCKASGSGALGTDEDARQWRAARAAILLMGDSGLRRAEAALARREELRPAELRDDAKLARDGSPGSSQNTSPGAARPTPARTTPAIRTVWTLTVIGKRRKQRTVPVSAATIAALRAHWDDRGQDFDAARAQGPLIAPQWIPATRAALKRHDTAPEVPYTADALGRLARMPMQRLSAQTAALAEFTAEELLQLANTSAHAFRHTFGTRAVAREMPTDVVQAILGHASLQTTSIYVRAERRRMLEAAARYYAEDEG